MGVCIKGHSAAVSVVAHPTLLLLLLPPCIHNPTGRLERGANNAARYEQPKADAGGTCASEFAVEVEILERSAGIVQVAKAERSLSWP